jgi:hypothetical protein
MERHEKMTCIINVLLLIYKRLHARCVRMYMCLNGIEHIYTVTARMHMMIYGLTLRCARMFVLSQK